jgi:hypothetical protein
VATYLATLQGLKHTASFLMLVSAVGKTACRDDWPHFGQQPFDFFWPQSRQFELANAGSVNDPAADIQMQED